MFIRTIYIKTFIIYVKKIYKYINYKRLTENIKEKGLELLINKDIILINTPLTNRSERFIYYKRRGKLIGYNRPKKILEPIYFKIVELINFFTRS